MKTAFQFVVSSVVVLAIFAFKYSESEWVTYAEKKKAKFEVQFPEKPGVDKKGDNWYLSSTLAEPLTQFYVVINFNTVNYTEQTFRDKAKTSIDVIEQIYSTKITDRNEIQYNGGLCIEYQFDSFGMKSITRAFYKDNKYFELQINPIVGVISVVERDKFFNSFHYLP